MSESTLDILGGHEGQALAAKKLIELIGHVGAVAPQLGRYLSRDGLGSVGSSLTVGYRDFALLTCAALAAIGVCETQFETYARIALQHGATEDELLDVIDLVGVYAGAPCAVNAALQLDIGPLRERGPGDETVVTLGDHETGLRDNGGPGAPTLLIHALSMDHRIWRKVHPTLAAAAAA